MVRQVDGNSNRYVTNKERNELIRLRNLFTNLLMNDGRVSQQEVGKLIEMATKDAKLTPHEVQLLAQGFYDNIGRFEPSALQAMQGFISQVGNLYSDISVRQVSASEYRESASLSGLRQQVAQLAQSNQPISPSDAQSLINRALQDEKSAPDAVVVLADFFVQQSGRFTPPAQERMSRFLSGTGVRPTGMRESWGWNQQSTFVNAGSRPSQEGWGWNSGGAQGGARNALEAIRNNFVASIQNNGYMDHAEVNTLLQQVVSTGPTRDALELVADGFRKNQNLFSPEAQQLMTRFLRQYNY